MKTFELRSLPDGKKRRLFFVQLPYRTNVVTPVPKPTTVAMLEGGALDMAAEPIDRLLNLPEVEHGFLDREALIPIDEDAAIRLGLVFVGINSLRSPERVAKVIEGIQAMPLDRAAMWLADITNDGPDGNMLKAFRVAMTGEA